MTRAGAGALAAAEDETEVEITVDEPRWREAVPEIEDIARAAARAALSATPMDEAAELSLLLTDDRRMAALNARYRGAAEPTNVLSFAAGDAAPGGPRLLGDVVLGFETVAREAAAQGKSLADHASHLVVHGTLHLFGHDHQRAEEAQRMETLERRILAGLGVADPYAVDGPAP